MSDLQNYCSDYESDVFAALFILYYPLLVPIPPSPQSADSIPLEARLNLSQLPSALEADHNDTSTLIKGPYLAQ